MCIRDSRYAYLCCSGYSAPRLYGMWTGEWNTGWGSKYTMDANVNQMCIRDRGSHRELMAKGGVYSELYSMYSID